MPASSIKKVLVVGATGATGKHVVQFLLDKGHNVVAVARSEEKMRSLLKQQDYGNNLTVKELSISDVEPSEMRELTKGCDAVVRCVGI
jgi:nucleoside-diphosphate-sugar epimerase